MIIWLNGAFGSGKTQTAYELHRRLPDSFVYDPENVGYWLRQNEPAQLAKKNFQDEPLWRSVNREMLLHLAREYDGVLLVPMTLVSEAYYGEIIGALRRADVEVAHFVLRARPETVHRRLRKRLEFGNSWGAQQLSACLAAFQSKIFENQIDTDGMSVSEVAEEIARRLSLPLLPREHPVRSAMRRLATQVKAIQR